MPNLATTNATADSGVFARGLFAFLIGDRTSDMQAAAAAGIEGHRYADGDLDSLVAGLLRRTEADASDEPEMEPQ